jgi:nucleotide-binding universal stress UspA family protein
MEHAEHSIRIAVGLDGSDGSAHGLQWAIDLAKRLDAEIVAVHVDRPVAYLPAPMGLLPPAETPEQQAELQHDLRNIWCAPLRESGIRFRSILVEGTPIGTALIQAALDAGADLIVVGSRGLGGLAEVFLGSVSHQVAHHSPIPVVIVPPVARVKEASRRPEFAAMRKPTLVPVS